MKEYFAARKKKEYGGIMNYRLQQICRHHVLLMNDVTKAREQYILNISVACRDGRAEQSSNE
jgi:hypothetical protein